MEATGSSRPFADTLRGGLRLTACAADPYRAGPVVGPNGAAARGYHRGYAYRGYGYRGGSHRGYYNGGTGRGCAGPNGAAVVRRPY